MRKIITLFFVLAWVLTSYSQKVIELEETTLHFEPTANIILADYAKGIVKVRENNAAQFQSNAVKFLIENFDLNEYREASGNTDGMLIVEVASSNGRLYATFDEKDELVKTYQKFKDIILPSEIRNQVYANYMGWTITKDRYIAYGKGHNIDTEKYIVFLKKGKDKERIKITPSAIPTGVASIEKY
jgi:hypothetical protein